MKKNAIGLVIGALTVVGLVSLLVFWSVNADKAKQVAEKLTQALQAEGLPLQSVRVAKATPLTLEITLTFDTQDSPERKAMILRARHAVQWHCAQLNLEEYQLGSYILLIESPSGQQLSWEQNFLYPPEASKTPGQYTLDFTQAQQYLSQAFQPGSATVERFELISESRDDTSVNTLYIRLVEPDLATLNRELPMRQVEGLLMTVNEQKLYPVDICWLEVQGPNAEVWVDLLYDYGLRDMSWWIADGVSMEWFPHPAPLPNQEPTQQPVPSEPYPVETPLPTTVNPYP